MNKKQTQKATKRTYSKPMLEQVRLVPEEAVLQACKEAGWPPCYPDPQGGRMTAS